MMISRISEKYLNESAKNNVKELLSFFKPFTAEQNEYWFIESSLMADHLEEIQMESFKTWHFQNFSYDNKEDTQFDEQKERKKPASALWAIDTLLKSLKSNRESNLDNRFFKSLNLRLLIHIVQDLHQPLHTTSTKFTEPFIPALANGDRGGNMFVFKFDPETDGKFKQQNAFNNEQPEDKLGYRLHKFLDYVMFEYKDITLPLTKENYLYIDKAANDLIQKYETDDIVPEQEIGETYDSVKWVREGIDLCKNEVYKGIEYAQPEKPSVEYISRMKVILERQIFKAGKRLANILNDLYTSHQNLDQNPIKYSNNKDYQNPDLIHPSEIESNAIQGVLILLVAVFNILV
jgi:hypothetical protein